MRRTPRTPSATPRRPTLGQAPQPARRARSSLLLGLLLTGGLYAAFSPAAAADQRGRRSPGRAGPRSCSSSAAPPATARTARASSPSDGNAVRPPAGRRRRRRRRLPGRHRPDADGPARRRRPRSKKVVYTPEEIAALAAYVASLGPGPAIPDKSDYDLDGRRATPGRSSAAASSSAPTARPATTSPAPAARCRGGSYAPELTRRHRQAHLRGDADRPAADAGLLRRRPHARGEARHHRLPQAASRTARATAASRSARSARSARACSPGSSASAPWSASRSGSPSHTARSKKGVKA